MTSKEGQSASEVDKREKSVRQRWTSTAGHKCVDHCKIPVYSCPVTSITSCLVYLTGASSALDTNRWGYSLTEGPEGRKKIKENFGLMALFFQSQILSVKNGGGFVIGVYTAPKGTLTLTLIFDFIADRSNGMNLNLQSKKLKCTLEGRCWSFHILKTFQKD